jgi:hypothetical protein
MRRKHILGIMVTVAALAALNARDSQALGPLGFLPRFVEDSCDTLWESGWQDGSKTDPGLFPPATKEDDWDWFCSLYDSPTCEYLDISCTDDPGNNRFSCVCFYEHHSAGLSPLSNR